MAFDPSIIMGYRGMGELPNPMNQLAQVSQIQAAQQQGQMNQMKIEEMLAERKEIDSMAAVLKDKGYTPRSYLEMMVSSRNPERQKIGAEGLIRLGEQDKFQAVAGKLYPGLFGSTPAAAAPTNAMAPTPPEAGSFAADVAERRGTAPVNAMAPAPAAPVNALAEPQAKTPDQLRQEIMMFSQSTDPRAKAFAEILKAQLTESLKAHVVGSNLVVGTKSVYTAPPAPTETSRLQTERAALIQAGVPENDPRIQAYDQKLASGESQSTKLQRELQNAITNKAGPAVIAQLKRDIVNLHPGLAMQNVTGVDANGNQIVTRFAGAGGGPQGQFGLDQTPVGTARLKIQSVLPTSLPPEVLTQAAAQFNFNGKLPSIGSGVQAEVNKIAILTEAAKTNPTDAIQKELNKSYTPALSMLAKQEQQVTSYVKTFDKNIDLARDQVDKIAKTNVPVINKWLLNPYQRSLTDDPELKALNIYVSSIQAEFAKIQSGAMGNTATADAAIKRANDTINAADSPKAFLAALDAMQAESRNRLSSFPETRKEMTNRMRGTSSSQYVETKTLPDGRTLGKKADGTLEEIK